MTNIAKWEQNECELMKKMMHELLLSKTFRYYFFQ